MANDIPARHSLSVASLPSIADFSEPISEADEIESVRQLQKLGDRAFKKKDYAKASACYKDALEIDAENVQLLSKRAVSNIELEDYIEARKDADILVKLNPHVPQGHYLLAVCLDNLGEYGPAISSFLRALRHDQNHQNQLVDNVAVVASNLCSFSEDVLHKIDESGPIEKLMLVAECLFDSKQYNICIHVLQTVQDLKQTTDEVQLKSQYLLATCFQKLDDPDRALDHFHTLLSRALHHKDNIHEALAYQNLAQLSLKVGRIQQGIVNYEKLLSTCEDLKNVQQKTDGEVGETSVEKVDHLVRDRFRKQVHEILTSAYRSASDLTQALFHADRYLHLTVKDETVVDREIIGKAYLLVGFLREGLGDYATALKHYQEYFAISKMKSDRAGMARAYGCLGRIYHQLHNHVLAQSYYEQQLAITEKFGYVSMVAVALKSLSKLCVDTEDYANAMTYLEKYLRVSRKLDEFHTECEAFMDIGDLCCLQDNLLQAEYYFEQAQKLAERTKLAEHVHRAGSKLAGVLVKSKEEKNVERARFLCQESITFYHKLKAAHEDEGSVFPEDMELCINQSYAILKLSLCKLKRNLEALEYAESQSCRGFQEILSKQAGIASTDNGVKLSFEDICKIVNSQSSTVVYYDVTDFGILMWVLVPNEGCVYFTGEQHVRDAKCTQYLRELIHSIHSEGALQSMYDCEYRALPMLDSETHKMQTYFKSLSRQRKLLSKLSSDRQDKHASSTPPDGNASPDPLQTLYNILWRRVIDHVVGNDVIVVTNSILTQLPFDALTDAGGYQLGQCYQVTTIPSLLLLQHLVSNQTNINELYSTDIVDDKKSQASAPAPTRNSPPPIYLDHMHRVIIPPANRPHHPIRDTMKIAPKMSTAGMPNPTYVTFDTNFHDVVADTRDPVLALEERRVKEANTRGSTLISCTWSGKEVPSLQDGKVQGYRQREGRAGIVVMGNPKLPEKMRLHGKSWTPNSELEIAQVEVHKIADYLNTDPWLGSKVTKDALMTQMPQATVVHLAMYGSWEDGVLACTPNPTTQPLGEGEGGGVYPETAYQIGVQDVLGMKLCSQLVVLSCCYGNRHRNLHLDLPLAFLAAGAQCVLVILWAVSDFARDKFWHHFYLALQRGTMVSLAVHEAKQALRHDDRFQDARHWAAFHLIGFDQYINLMTIKHSMADRLLNDTQNHVLGSMSKDVLNVKEEDTEGNSEAALIKKLCHHLAATLTHHVNHPTVLPCVLKLLQKSKHLLGDHSEGENPSWILPVGVFSSPAPIPFLSFLGFHFQPKGPTSHEPYIVFPTWDPNGLLPPALQATEALIDVIASTECSHTLAKVLEAHDKLSSGLIDILSITKHMPEVQLRGSDSGIQSMWVQNTARALLQAMGFRQVGKLIMFDGNNANKKQLHAVLQVLCAISGEKGKNMLERLDMRYLGIATSRLASKSPRQSPVKSARLLSSSTVRVTTPPAPPVSRLRTLNPVVLPGNKMAFSTPWWSEEAGPIEMKEKMKLAKSLSDTHVDFQHQMKNNKKWHLKAIVPQAVEEIEKFGRPTSKPKKVKMKPGMTPSMPRVPVDHVDPLKAEALEQRRDYAHFLSRVRSLDLERHHRDTIKGLFLPYVNAKNN